MLKQPRMETMTVSRKTPCATHPDELRQVKTQASTLRDTPLPQPLVCCTAPTRPGERSLPALDAHQSSQFPTMLSACHLIPGYTHQSLAFALVQPIHPDS